MRILVALLLLANLAFYGWAHWIAAEPLPAADPLKASVPRLELAHEMNAGPPPSALPRAPQRGAGTTGSASSSASAAGATGGAWQCVTLGPYDTDAAAQQFATVLRAKGFEALGRAARGDAADGFWVYIGGLESLTAQHDLARQLQARGITDAEEMPPSPSGLRVSLGVFSDRERAERRAAAVTELGFTPRVGEHTQAATRYFLDVRLRGGTQGLKPADLETLNHGGANVAVAPCPARAAMVATDPPPA